VIFSAGMLMWFDLRHNKKQGDARTSPCFLLCII